LQPKAEKTAEVKRQTQLISATEVGRADTTKENEEKSSSVPEILNAACSNKEKPNKIATDG
jgi:YTH domain-containing family protein